MNLPELVIFLTTPLLAPSLLLVVVKNNLIGLNITEPPSRKAIIRIYNSNMQICIFWDTFQSEFIFNRQSIKQ